MEDKLHDYYMQARTVTHMHTPEDLLSRVMAFIRSENTLRYNFTIKKHNQFAKQQYKLGE